MAELGAFLATLPAPLGLVVTGLLPIIAGVAAGAAIWAWRRRRWVVVTVSAVIAVLALSGAIAFLGSSSAQG